MAKEVECKMAIDPSLLVSLPAVISQALGNIAAVHIDKYDVYYGRKGKGTEFRIRKDGTNLVVTRKHKEDRADGVEVNREIEFHVSNGDVKAFFTSLGYTPLIEKRKVGSMWKNGNLTVELVHVDHLGDYLEMELLLEDDANDMELRDALDRLAALRSRFGVADLPLEGRYYIDMLRNMEKWG